MTRHLRNLPTEDGEEQVSTRLPLWTKLVYGTGDWSLASFGTLRQVFYAIFLTDAVGLDPRLASIGALLGVIWDAVNDPLVGTLSDKVQTRWGRRRPFLLLFALPFGLSFLLLWWAPPWHSQIILMIHITLAYMISDTMQTLVSVPFYALTPEISSDYDERTSLATYRMFFNLLASLATAVSAPAILDAALVAGISMQQGYLLIAALFGGMAMFPFWIIFLAVKERSKVDTGVATNWRVGVRDAWRNVPFRYATLLYMLNWISFDLVGLMLPFYLVYWVGQGNILASVNLFGESLALESAVLGLMLITAVPSLALWAGLSRLVGKRAAYIIGMTPWLIAQCLVLLVQPLQYSFALVLSVVIGLSVSAAHMLPDAIFPDVIEWGELRTGRRDEGTYYGVKNFIRKMAGGAAIFLGLQVLGWYGYQAPPDGATQFAQSETAIRAIRITTSPVVALLLSGAMLMAWLYPLTRQRHARVLRLLSRRRQRRERMRLPAAGE